MSSPSGIQGITEADIANYLAQTPGFFERHAELLGSVQLTSPHGRRLRNKNNAFVGRKAFRYMICLSLLKPV